MRTGRPTGTRPIAVAIPAKDEADEIVGCLSALAVQDTRVDAVVLCVNNTTDDSIGRIDRIAHRLPFALHVLQVTLPPERACAGVARGLAMDRAAELAGPRGVLLTTDADGRAAPGWVGANVAAIADGADAVAGRAEIEPVGARLIPAHLHAIDARECAYATLLDEIAALVDPDPFDPWPRHEEHSGASIAVTVAAYRRAGGIPPVRLAEDRAFFDALRRVDARIRHSLEATVVVSARTVGRAPGGMADTMRRRTRQVDALLDERLEPAVDAFRRARVRAELRGLWAGGVCGPREIDRLSRRLGAVPSVLPQGMGPRIDPRVKAGDGDDGSVLPAPRGKSARGGRTDPRVKPGDGDDGRVLPASRLPPPLLDAGGGRLPGAGSGPLPDAEGGPLPGRSDAPPGISDADIAQAIAERYFGTAWAKIEAASPVLARRRVPLADLPMQTAQARQLRDRLRSADPFTHVAGPADTQARAAAD